MNLTIGVTTAQRGNVVIFYNDFPIPLCDVEAAEGFEILLPGDERSRTVLSNRPGEAVARDDEVTTLAQGCYDIHGQDNRSLRLGLVKNGEVCCRSLPGSERLITNILIAGII